MDEDSGPKFTIKKRKGPSKASSTKLSFNGGDQDDDDPTTRTLSNQPVGGGEEEEGSAVVIRNRGKKTPSGRSKQRESMTGGGGNKLSFGSSSTTNDLNTNKEEREDEETSFVKRSLNSLSTSTSPAASSKRSTTSGGLLRPSNLSQSIPSSGTAQTSNSIYSKEYLEQLKSSQLSAPPRPSSIGEEGGFDDLTMSKFGSNTNLDQDLSDSIPTSTAIAQAKLRREELRKTGQIQDDYISLSSTNTTVGLYSNKGGDSRLVREEDELGDGDEDLNQFTGSLDKIPLGRKANLDAAQKLKGEMGEMIQGVEEEVEEEDEEMKQWEEGQIRRGGTADRNRGGKENQNSTRKIYRPLPIPQSSTLPTLSSITSRLSQNLSTLESSHSLDLSSLNHFTHERQELDKQEEELRLEVEKTERKNRWFQDFKETVEIWCGFLDEKFPRLEEIEKEYLGIQREKFQIVSKRRIKHLSDDVSLFTGARVPTTQEKLFKIASPRAAATEEEEDQAMRNEQEEEEEEEEALEPRSFTRQSRRRERQERFETSTTNRSGGYPDYSGFSDPGYFSDSNLTPTQSQDLSTALDSLQTSLIDLFRDVKNPEFRDPNLTIKGKFQEWKNLWKEEYEMLFGSLGLSGVWEFWTRVEMASWNPFQIEELPKSGGAELSQWKWYQALSTYGHPEDQTEKEQEEAEVEETIDESTEVVNALVTSVLIPRLGQLAKESYDPLSSRQTISAIKLVDEISYSVEKDSQKFEGLIQSFLYRLRIEVQVSKLLLLPNLNQIFLPSLSYDPSTFQARKYFLLHNLKLLTSCIRWRRFMKSLRLHPLSEGEEEQEGERTNSFDELVTRELIGKVMLPLIEVGWSTSDGEKIGTKVLELLPKQGMLVPEALKRRLQGEQVQ
ncbi:hypothetical protein JCM3765_005437 [Sporobolomyces pararoseus]